MVRHDSNEGEDEAGEYEDPIGDIIRHLEDVLAADIEDLDAGAIAGLRELAGEVEPEDETLASEMRVLADEEEKTHPNERAKRRLRGRCPDFVRFDEAARGLQTEYDLAAAADNPDEALANLAALADLNLPKLRDAVVAKDTGGVRDLREAANKRLLECFQVWNQGPQLEVSLETDRKLLRIHVKSGTGPTMRFDERSDGLRQFVALVALTAQETRSVPPILLIDEIETHLHYDAQADLVDVLASQSAVSQVIYSTHSAACLPEDLGSAVRTIEGVGDRTESKVRQAFWDDNRPGMGALLMAMGAASLAYVPLRPAIIVEGGSDLVLLPTLMREAIQRDHLGFAIVPGASGAPPERIAGLDLQGIRTLWVFDSDNGGRKRRNELIDNHSIPAERILLLDPDESLEIEDLVEPHAYCSAVNLYLEDVGCVDEFREEDLPPGGCQRPDAVEKWCEARSVHPPGKPVIANKLVELSGEESLLAPEHVDRLIDIHSRIERLQLDEVETEATGEHLPKNAQTVSAGPMSAPL